MNLTEEERNEVLQAVGTSITSLRKRIVSAHDVDLQNELQERLDTLTRARNGLELEWAA